MAQAPMAARDTRRHFNAARSNACAGGGSRGVFNDFLTEPARLDADGRILLRVVGFRLAEGINADGVLLQLIGLPGERFLGQVFEQAALNSRRPEQLALHDALDLQPSLVLKNLVCCQHS